MCREIKVNAIQTSHRDACLHMDSVSTRVPEGLTVQRVRLAELCCNHTELVDVAESTVNLSSEGSHY